MKNIAVIGYLGFQNFGDDLMLYGLLNALNRKGNYKIKIFVKENSYDSQVLDKYNNLNIKFIEINKAVNIFFPLYIFSVDVVMWCGGTCIYEDPNDIHLSGLKWINKIVNVTNWLKKDFYFINIGINKLISKNAKNLFIQILSKSKYISCRDVESLNNLKEYNYLDCGVGSDLAFLNTIPKTKKSENEEYIVFCGHYQYRNDSNLIKKYAIILSNLSQELNKKIYFVPLHVGISNDNLFHTNIISELTIQTQYELLKGYTISQIEEIFSKSYFVISMRLHALIYAELNSKPSIGINYNDKVKYFMSKLHNSNNTRLKNVGETIATQEILDIKNNYQINNEFLEIEKFKAKNGIVFNV